MSLNAGSSTGGGTDGAHRGKGVYWILGGLVVAGIAAVWNWARRLPRLPK